MYIELLRKALRGFAYWLDGRTREHNGHVTPLVCPACGTREAWAYAAKPFAIICNRKTHCGQVSYLKDLFPELLANLEREFKPTPRDPHRPARKYLQARGIARVLDGLAFEYWPRTRSNCGGALMFPLGKGVYNGRLLAPPPGEQKGHNKGSVRGRFWLHPAWPYGSCAWIVEGIIDALSLLEMGLPGVAVLSAGAPPILEVFERFSSLVLAFDGDAAGRKALHAWQDFKRPSPGQVSLQAVCLERGDFNDLLRGLGSEEARRFIDANMPALMDRAALHGARSAQEYGQLFHQQRGFPAGLFGLDGQMFYSSLEGKGEQRHVATHYVGNFECSVVHYVRNHDEQATGFCIVLRSSATCALREPVVLTPQALSRPELLTAALLNFGVHWQGGRAPTHAFAKKLALAKAPVVRQLPVLGFDQQSDSYVFPEFAIGPDGAVSRSDARGIITVGAHLMRPFGAPAALPRPGLGFKVLHERMVGAWGLHGAVCVAWCVASWFSNQIRESIGFFPFLSLYGDTQTGKTRLVRLLNAMQCIDEEGLAMRRVNTAKGEIRALAQRSGLFKALLEWPTGKQQPRFDLSSILTLYNKGASLQLRAVKSMDSQTSGYPFLGALAFVQNVEPFRQKSEKERVISLCFRSNMITAHTRAAFDSVAFLPVQEVGHVLWEVLAERRFIETEWRRRFDDLFPTFYADVPSQRVAENHALVLVFHDLIAERFKLDCCIAAHMVELAKKKHDQCSKGEEGLAEYFLDLLLDREGKMNDPDWLFLSQDKGVLRFHLGRAVNQLRGEGHALPHVAELQEVLKAHEACLHTHKTARFDGKIRRAWVFDLAKLRNED